MRLSEKTLRFAQSFSDQTAAFRPAGGLPRLLRNLGIPRDGVGVSKNEGENT